MIKKNVFRSIKGWGLNHLTLRLREENGLSLVEAVVAIAILSIGLTTFIIALSAGSISVSAQSELAVAQRLAQTQLESIKAAGYSSSYSKVPAPADYTVSIAVEYIYTNGDIQKVTVTVNHGGNPVLVAEDYKVNR